MSLKLSFSLFTSFNKFTYSEAGNSNLINRSSNIVDVDSLQIEPDEFLINENNSNMDESSRQGLNEGKKKLTYY